MSLVAAFSDFLWAYGPFVFRGRWRIPFGRDFYGAIENGELELRFMVNIIYWFYFIYSDLF